MRFLYNLLLIILIVNVSSLYTHAQKHTPGDFQLSDTLQKNDKLIKGVLDNGFTYYILPNGYPRKKVELRLLVKAGSLNETDNQQGLAHFMEHMNFNGSRTFKKNEFNHFFQSIGVRFGADVNAFTFFDRTVYMLPVPTQKFENVEKAFRVMADWAHYATLQNEDIDSERGVVLSESLLSKGVNKRITDTLLYYLYPAYSKRMPIGLDTIIKTFHYDTLRSFYRDWYRPDLMALVVIGDIDPKVAQKQIEINFANWQMPKNPRPQPESITPPNLSKNQGFVIIDKEIPRYNLSVFFNMIPQKPLRTLEDFKNDLTFELLNIIAYQRIQEALQDANTPFVNASFSWDRKSFLVKGYSMFSMSVTPGVQGLEKSVQGLVNELRKMLLGFTKTELDNAQKLVLTSLENLYREKDRIPSATLSEDLEDNFYEGDISSGIEKMYAYTKYVLPKITVQDLRKICSKFLANPHFLASLQVPISQKSQAPKDNNELIAIVERAFGDNSKVEAKEDKVLSSKLLDEPTNPGAIRSIKENSVFNTTIFELSNGIQVELKPTTFKNDEILIQFVSSGGYLNLPSADKHNIYLLPIAMKSMGYGKFNGADLSKVLSDKTVSLNHYISDLSHGFRGSSSIADLETLFQLLYLKINNPRFDQTLFDAIKMRLSTSIANLGAKPENAFFDTVSKIMFNNNPYARLIYPKTDQLNNTSLSRVKEIYKELFQNPANFKLYVVGNTSVDSLRPLLEKYIASLNVKVTPRLPFKDVGLRYKKGNTHFEFYKGEENKAMLLLNFFQEQPYFVSQEIPTKILEGMLEMRMIDEIREKHSWVYTSSVNSEYTRIPYSRMRFLFVFPCSPEHVDSITNAVMKELADLSDKKNKKKYESYLQRAKAQDLEQIRLSEKENSYWLQALVSHGIFEESPSLFLERSELINKVTLKDVQYIAKNIFKKNNLFRSILYPEKWKKK